MKNADRWKQRLENLNKAMKRLADACARDRYPELETAGLVQTYEFTFELAWKTMKDWLIFEGYDVKSPRETIKKAFEMELIADARRGSRHLRRGTSSTTPTTKNSPRKPSP